jgi:hypothetical protein
MDFKGVEKGNDDLLSLYPFLLPFSVESILKTYIEKNGFQTAKYSILKIF